MTERRGITRRQLLAGSGAATAWAMWGRSPFGREASAWTRAVTLRPDGTTLQSAITIGGPGPGGYVHLFDGPAWPFIVRSDLRAPMRGREDRRRPLAAFVHFTDTHVVDAQSPGRVEFLDDVDPLFSSAWRPQETMTTQVLSSMVRRINDLGAGPVTGRRFDAMVATGDNIDNQEEIELGWFLSVLDGGNVTPASGDPATYHGVQDGYSPSPRYWHPDPAVADPWKTDRGFPADPGLLAAAIGAHHSPGLSVPWYSVFGNHDCNVQGNGRSNEALTRLFVGDRKVTELPEGESAFTFILRVFYDSEAVLADLQAGRYPMREVPADPRRRPLSRREWVQAHIDSSPGHGHGFTAEDADRGRLYHTFELSPEVLGVSLDSTNHAGGVAGADGSIGEGQLAWMERSIRSVSSRWFAPDGSVVRGGSTDRLVVVFSHHTAATMTATDADPDAPHERRVLGPEVIEVLLRYPNVVAWVNGHTHTNEIVAHRRADGSGFWEISTASHIDYPQHARIIEIVDNEDTTLSIFATLVDHAAPARVDIGDHSVSGLASLSRELSANDRDADPLGKLGTPGSHNVELVVTAPARIVATPTTSTTAPSRPVAPVAPPAVPVGAAPSFTG